ncbi:HEAT repeat domain-containing protein [Streptomyces griseoviridis]|uniref:HEAT repeat domain-containing protein n=1 Tax=Streptomyces griseoviridis TaxID=45398 RepID=UPI0034239CE3
MFTGIDEVDWASMRHAYGSAEDVPALLWGLASADRAEREVALDGMYGAVHHQGDVYDSTLACLPFLFELVEREEVHDRDEVVELLVSIGGEDGSDGGAGVPALDLDRVAEPVRESYLMARTAVRAGAPAFARLAGDLDPGVRRAAPGALVRFLDEPARVLDLLRQRVAVERDDRVLVALTESLGLFARRHPGQARPAVTLLTGLSAPPYGPGQRLAALGQLTGCAPDLLPADLVDTVVGLLRDRSRERVPHRADEPERPATDTLVGRIRQLRPSDEEGSQLLRTLHGGLGDRVADRIALLEGQLTSPDPSDRCNAVWMSAGLLHGWRGDYRRPVELIGAQLAEGKGRLREAAMSVLSDLYDLAAPAADHLDALVGAHSDLWVRQWERGAPTLGDPLKALARSGDPRAVPVLAFVLSGPVVPDDLGNVVVHLGRAAVPLAPALRHRLATTALHSPEAYARATPLLSALAALRDARAVPEVLQVVLGVPEGVRSREVLVASAVRTLGAFGPAAQDAAPVLRSLLDSEWAVSAADALWSLQGDPDAVRPVLVRELANEQSRTRLAAADSLARLGQAARPALPELRRMARSAQPWERVAAACAVWRIGGGEAPGRIGGGGETSGPGGGDGSAGGGDAATAAAVLRAAWAEDPLTRRPIADCLAALGPAGAPLHDLVRAELASPRRHTASPGGWAGHGAFADERLLRVCREVLEGG